MFRKFPKGFRKNSEISEIETENFRKMTSKEAFLAAFVSKNNLFSEISETFGKVPKFPKDFSESFGNVGEGGARNHVSRL